MVKIICIVNISIWIEIDKLVVFYERFLLPELH